MYTYFTKQFNVLFGATSHKPDSYQFLLQCEESLLIKSPGSMFIQLLREKLDNLFPRIYQIVLTVSFSIITSWSYIAHLYRWICLLPSFVIVFGCVTKYNASNKDKKNSPWTYLQLGAFNDCWPAVWKRITTTRLTVKKQLQKTRHAVLQTYRWPYHLAVLLIVSSHALWTLT